MRPYLSVIPLIAITLISIFNSSCSKEKGCTDPAALNFNADAEKNCCCEYEVVNLQPFSIHHNYNGAQILPNEPIQEETTELKFTLLQYYISGFSLYQSGEEVAFIDTVIFVKGFNANDLEDPTPFNFNLEIPEGNYDGISFHWGLDSITNESSFPLNFSPEHPLGPKSPSMYWSWDTDYLFLKTEGKYTVKNGEERSLTWHIGNNALYSKTSVYPISILEGGNSLINLDMDLRNLVVKMQLEQEDTFHSFIPDSTMTKFRTFFPQTFSIQE